MRQIMRLSKNAGSTLRTTLGQQLKSLLLTIKIRVAA